MQHIMYRHWLRKSLPGSALPALIIMCLHYIGHFTSTHTWKRPVVSSTNCTHRNRILLLCCEGVDYYGYCKQGTARKGGMPMLEYNNAVVRWAIPTLYPCYANPSLAIQIRDIAAAVVGGQWRRRKKMWPKLMGTTFVSMVHWTLLRTTWLETLRSHLYVVVSPPKSAPLQDGGMWLETYSWTERAAG